MNTTVKYWMPGDKAMLDGKEVTLIVAPGSANHLPSRRGHHCHNGERCRRWDIAGAPGRRTAWECELDEIPTPGLAATVGSEDFPAVDTRMSWRTPDGRVLIVVGRGRFVWTVTVEIGGFRVEDNCGSYPTESTARAAARMYATLYRDEA